MHWLIAVGGTIVAAILSGALMSRLIEWPIIKIRDRIFPSRAQESEPSALSGFANGPAIIPRRSPAEGLASWWTSKLGSARMRTESWLRFRA
jgi:peptidoglycan/LPS O-acetylase OafA/YrhL